MGRLSVDNNEFWIKDGIELPLEFNFMNDYEKWCHMLLHREDGPAVIWFNGTKLWLLNGLRHRLDGSAEITSNGYEFWYLNDILVDGRIYRKIQNSLKEELLVYMIDPEYRRYLPLIEHRLNQ